ncbi:MAG: ABC transporter ATP-binding protein [Bacteroidetes bacterium]|nr:ABC transporter ATP-binding protein [Bacteroidota bacterium]
MEINIKNLTKEYNKKKVLNIDKLKIRSGEIFGLVGNNGAGKTTFFRLLLDLIKSDSGEILIGDIDVTKSEKWKNYTGSYLDEDFLINFLTAEEYFYFVGNIYGFTKNEINIKLKQYSKFFNNEILAQKGKYIREYSQGNKQKIGIISTFLIEPKIIILDEPFNNLDPTSQMLLVDMLKEYNEINKATILISSHNLNNISEICHRIIILEKGEIIKDLSNNKYTLNELKKYFYQE